MAILGATGCGTDARAAVGGGYTRVTEATSSTPNPTCLATPLHLTISIPSFNICFRYRKIESKIDMDARNLYSGLVRLHILHHAAEEPICGIWISQELARHGYELSAGTLYPILHGMEGAGYLQSGLVRQGKSARRMYRITPVGRRALKTARHRVQELFGEMFGIKHRH